MTSFGPADAVLNRDLTSPLANTNEETNTLRTVLQYQMYTMEWQSARLILSTDYHFKGTALPKTKSTIALLIVSETPSFIFLC